ncbi:MAG TPA: hypothetical protein VL101_02115 [Nordella sp.]|nr:hypothetical protein [Nordella sp.]
MNYFAEKDSRQINILEQILIAKVFNFGGICSVTEVMLHCIKIKEIFCAVHDRNSGTAGLARTAIWRMFSGHKASIEPS